MSKDYLNSISEPSIRDLLIRLIENLDSLRISCYEAVGFKNKAVSNRSDSSLEVIAVVTQGEQDVSKRQ